MPVVVFLLREKESKGEKVQGLMFKVEMQSLRKLCLSGSLR